MAAQSQVTSPAMIEDLEPRQLFAAALVGSQLQIIGTHKNDNIRVLVELKTRGDLTVVINGVTQRIPLAGIQTIIVQAGLGNDRVVFEKGDSTFQQPTTIYGSGGNDTIFGGSGRDRIYGGLGADFINGGGNRDIIYGEEGNDILDGDLGPDFLDGGMGNDSLIGGLGIDAMYGQAGNDTIQGQDSTSDRLDGGLGDDFGFGDFSQDNFVGLEHTQKS
ncbi:MAG TPA: hypothetical protein VHD56_16005 [Tepidisphaeraceae bacterium]|nr:hypothetical protein [Tepidisphaeraceae bacterium]